MSKIEVTKTRKYVTVGREGVAARRSAVFKAAQEFLAETQGPVKQADVYRAVLAKCGFDDNPKVWNDLGKALEAVAQKAKEDKKRAVYSLKGE